MRGTLGLLVALATGCDGEGALLPAPTLPTDGAPRVVAPPPEPPAVVRELDVSAGEPAVIAASGALPVWRGVLERGRLLARRGQEGALVGTVGDGGDDLVLIDETRGRGALFVRLALPDGAALAAGDRAIVWGGFAGAAGVWRWQASRIGRLPRGEAPLAPRLPSHRLGPPAERLPEETVTPLELATAIVGNLRRRSREVPLRFTVIEPPMRLGDGWRVAEPGGVEVVALVVLPGEEPIYGGQDYLAAEERWSLERGATYLVTAAVPPRLRRGGPDDLPFLEALDVPVRAPAAIAP